MHTVRDEITRQHFELALSRQFLYHYAYPPPSRWSYGLLGSLGRRHAQIPCDFGLTRSRNVRCHQGHWSWSWPVWPHIEVYRVENPILHETELGGVFRPRPLGELAFSFSQCTSSYYELLHWQRHWENENTSSPSGLGLKTPLNFVSCRIGFSTLYT